SGRGDPRAGARGRGCLMSADRISGAAVPYLPRGVRLHDDRVRGIRVLLAPERVVQLGPGGHANLSELDGKRSLAEVIETLCTRYDAPPEQIEGDVQEFLRDLMDRRMVFLDGEA